MRLIQRPAANDCSGRCNADLQRNRLPAGRCLLGTLQPNTVNIITGNVQECTCGMYLAALSQPVMGCCNVARSLSESEDGCCDRRLGGFVDLCEALMQRACRDRVVGDQDRS